MPDIMYFSKISIDFDGGEADFQISLFALSKGFCSKWAKSLEISQNLVHPPSKSIEIFEKYTTSGIGIGFVIKESGQRCFLLILSFWIVHWVKNLNQFWFLSEIEPYHVTHLRERTCKSDHSLSVSPTEPFPQSDLLWRMLLGAEMRRLLTFETKNEALEVFFVVVESKNVFPVFVLVRRVLRQSINEQIGNMLRYGKRGWVCPLKHQNHLF